MRPVADLPVSYRALLAVPGFVRLVGATLLVRTAASMLQLALVLFVLGRYGSPTPAGASVFLLTAPGRNARLELGGIVRTLFDSRTKISAQVVTEVREHFFYRVYDTVIPRTVRLSEAPSFGKTILEHDPTGPGAKAYRALAQEFLRRHDPKVSSPAVARPTVAPRPATETTEVS